jgi:hypothetical protein
MRFLQCVDVGVPNDDFSGPDLAVIILPDNKLGDITARKSFFDISIKTEQRLTESRIENDGLWVAMGCVAHFLSTQEPSHGFTKVTGFPCVAIFAGISRRPDDGEYDFMHLNVSAEDYSNRPGTFGGLSGGGVWKLYIQRDRETLAYCVNFTSTILAGVIFYETLVDKKPSELRCHGGRSIYEKVYEKLIRPV